MSWEFSLVFSLILISLWSKNFMTNLCANINVCQIAKVTFIAEQNLDLAIIVVKCQMINISNAGSQIERLLL